ncbi:unnamed protein product [Heterotrigona itama]|uniref:Uncharacterized protein n=1 Tax=Heterotrigona itama TaxID=395501 RepID=A0A6V7HIE3_9HYME|nr:unnamed protein product [Heterotrigona itama]
MKNRNNRFEIRASWRLKSYCRVCRTPSLRVEVSRDESTKGGRAIDLRSFREKQAASMCRQDNESLSSDRDASGQSPEMVEKKRIHIHNSKFLAFDQSLRMAMSGHTSKLKGSLYAWTVMNMHHRNETGTMILRTPSLSQFLKQSKAVNVRKTNR